MFPCILHVWLFTHTYPENVSTAGNYTIRGALWSWHAVDAVCAAVRVVCALWSGHDGAVGVPLQGAGAGCCLLSKWCVQFGAMLVALRVVSRCRWKVLLEGAAELRMSICIECLGQVNPGLFFRTIALATTNSGLVPK